MQNLFAHKESAYEFKNNTCTVIFGQNRTDRGMDNNGAGKTTLFEAICIALTNESLRSDVKKDNFINRDADFCKVEMELYNPAMKMDLKIQRIFYRNKTAKVAIWENGELNNQITSVNEANRRVLELIGISREDLLRYFIISQDNDFTFFTASDVCKKEVMNRITSADMINPVIDELTLRFHRQQEIYDGLNAEVNKYQTRLETLEEQRKEALESSDMTNDIKIWEQSISNLKENKKSTALVIKDRQDEIDVLNKKVATIKVQDVTALKEKSKAKRKTINDLEKERNENAEIKRAVKMELESTITCPECGHEFIHQSELGLNIDDAKKLFKEISDKVEATDKKLKTAKDERDKLAEQIEKEEEKADQLDSLQTQIKQIQRRIKAYEEENASRDEKIKRLQGKIKDAKEQRSNDEAIKKLDAKVTECKDMIKTKQTELVPVEEELDLIKFWQFNMGKNGFTTYLANRSVKIIEGMTNSYLRKFGVDISVVINGFKILRSGEVREKIDVFVSNNGITAENFMSKSGGERGRVTLAGVLGIQHLINLSTNGKGLNLLLFDECFHGMDSRGQESIIKIFEHIGMTIMVITQNVSEGFNNENTLYVVKENDVSRYVSQQS